MNINVNYNIIGNNNSIVINNYNETEKQDIREEFTQNDFINSKSFKLYDRKLQTLEIAKLYRMNADYKKSRQIFYCARDVSVYEQSRKIKTISSCRNRMCPACAWRKSEKLYKRAVSAAVKAIEVDSKRSFVLMTFTLKSCEADKLDETITKLLSAYKQLIRKEKFKKMLGSIRSLEVTVNFNNMTYHPHIHTIFLVDKDYFYNENLYMTQDEIKKVWADKLGIEDIEYRQNLQVDVRKFANKYSLLKSLQEITKYITKYKDLANVNINQYKRAEALKSIDRATKNRRMIEFTKLLKEKQKGEREEINDTVLNYCFNYKTSLYEEI